MQNDMTTYNLNDCYNLLINIIRNTINKKYKNISDNGNLLLSQIILDQEITCFKDKITWEVCFNGFDEIIKILDDINQYSEYHYPFNVHENYHFKLIINHVLDSFTKEELIQYLKLEVEIEEKYFFYNFSSDVNIERIKSYNNEFVDINILVGWSYGKSEDIIFNNRLGKLYHQSKFIRELFYFRKRVDDAIDSGNLVVQSINNISKCSFYDLNKWLDENDISIPNIDFKKILNQSKELSRSKNSDVIILENEKLTSEHNLLKEKNKALQDKLNALAKENKTNEKWLGLIFKSKCNNNIESVKSFLTFCGLEKEPDSKTITPRLSKN